MSKTPTALAGRIGDADIRQLRIFRAVVDCGGFSAAETDLNMSVSAISIAIGDLEARVGMKLCQRGRAGFALTDEGRQVYQASLQITAALENFRTEVNSIHSRLRGELNIGITDNLVTMYSHMRVTNSLAALKRRGPEVRINIRMMPPDEIARDVLDGQLHVGVIPRLKPLSGLVYRELYGEEHQLYCGNLHALFDTLPEKLRRNQLSGIDAVATTRNLPPAAHKLMQEMRLAATASGREGIAFLVLSGEFIGFLPTHYAQRWVQEGRMQALLPEHFNFHTHYAAITRKGGRPNLVLQTYLEELERAENDRPGF